jgi:hypothetical protein
MSRLSALRKSFPLLALLSGAGLVLPAIHDAEAQQRRNPEASQQSTGNYVVQQQRGVGGYSLNLRDIWGPAKMPPTPRDFGPHFDFPPASLNGAPTTSPYLH